MGVFKGLKRSDVVLSDYVARKRWSVSGTELESLGVLNIRAYSGSVPLFYEESKNGKEGSYESQLVFREVDQMYYQGFQSDLGIQTGPVDLNLQTSITTVGARKLPEKTYSILDKLPFIVYISFPENIVGSHIELGSFRLKQTEADSISYVEEGYVELEPELKDPYYFENLEIGDMRDNTQGMLVVSGYTGRYVDDPEFKYPVPEHHKGKPVGDIIYSQGVLIVTDPFWAWYCANFGDTGTFEWQSNVPIHTLNVACKVSDFEFNTSNNPTSKKLTGKSDFTPYITSVGLYNNNYELIAVAKLSKPVKKLDNIGMTINVRLDI